MPRRRDDNRNHRGRGRGANGHRGRGRGGGGPHGPVSTTVASVVPETSPQPQSQPQPQPHPRHRYPHANADIDVVARQWSQPSTQSNTSRNGSVNWNWNVNVSRIHGPRRGGTPNLISGTGMPQRRFESPRRGNATPRGTGVRGGRGRGRGRGPTPDYGRRDPTVSATRHPGPHPHLGVGTRAKTFTHPKILGIDAPLSDLLYAARPLLRPVRFVRGTLTPFLFQQPEEVMNSVSQVADIDTTGRHHAPTADQVAQLFYGNASDSSDSESNDHDVEDELEEVDFADLAQVRAEVEAIAQNVMTMDRRAHQQDREEVIEEIDFFDLAAIRAKVDAAGPQVVPQDDVLEEETFTGVYNHVRDAMQAPSSMAVVDEDQPIGTRQTASPSTLRTRDNALDLPPSIIDTSDLSILGSRTQTLLDTILVDEETPSLADAAPVLSAVPKAEPPPSTMTPDAPTDDDSHPLFFVHTTPTRPSAGRSSSDVILVDRASHEALGVQDDEEQIVYVAPHPRSSRASPVLEVPVVPRVKLPQTSMLTGRPIAVAAFEGEAGAVSDRDAARTGLDEARAKGDEGQPAAITAFVPASNASAARPTARRMEVRLQRRRQRQALKRGRSGFGAFGAMVSEARLRDADTREKRRPRWATRRQGDSDLDWGTEDEDSDDNDDDGMDAISNDLGGMTIDPDLGLDLDAMQGFLKSMSTEGSQFVTKDNIEDEARMRLEDEEDQGEPEGSSDSEQSNDEENKDGDGEEEEEEAFNMEEAFLIAESEGPEELSGDSDDELSPGASFQARLRKLRDRSHSQHPETVRDISDDEEEDTLGVLPLTRGTNDEAFLAKIKDLLEEDSTLMHGSGRGHKQKKKQAIVRRVLGHDDDVRVDEFMDDPEFTTPVREKKGKKKGKGQQVTGDFAAELEAQWARDRAKKAERKRERQMARLLAALDPLHASAAGSTGGRGHPGQGQASKKAMRAAARLDYDKARVIAPRTIVNVDVDTNEGLTSLEAYVRAFAADPGGRTSVALPPMDKEARKVVHALAGAFGVKSVSKGKGRARYTTLARTTRTGVGVQERRVKAVMRGVEYERKGGQGNGGGGGRKGRVQMPKHQEGDEVGKEAPKIGENNVGFRMLASMGWSEGDRIGGRASAGIETPLTAIIKHSKLGLGATR